MKPPRRFAVAADAVFDGGTLHRDRAVMVEGSDIAGVVAPGDLPPETPIERLPPGLCLAPGFIDLQVNGGGDVLFNDQPTAEGIRAIVAAHRRFGTTSLLPTLISDREPVMDAALASVQAVLATDPAVLGIHLEGPFLSPRKPGVHDPAVIRPPRRADLDRLTSLSGGITLVTLAPEEAPSGFVAALARAGARVSLGHSMATYAQTKRALEEGVSGFTHLFNAMRPLDSREPGPIAAALETPGCWYGLIADGVHVHASMLKLALRGEGQPFLVTDAMPPTGGAKATFMLGSEVIRVEEGRCVRGDGTLAGAFLDMATAVRNCVSSLGVPLERALAMASATPAAFVGLGDRLGRLGPGWRADMVALDPERVEVHATWVAGQRDGTVSGPREPA